jgi:arylsulfatase A-like enzyme
VASFVGCPGPAKVVVDDLAASLAFADHWSPREVVRFGTPSAEAFLREGFYTEAGGAVGDRFLWSKGEAELALSWPAPEARAAVVEMRPYEAVRGQQVEVRLNGAPVGTFALNDSRFRYLVSLPASAQKAGENRLRFVFAHVASPAAEGGNADRRQLAAAFHTLTAGSASDPILQDLLGRGAPGPAAATAEAGVPAVEQMAPSALRFAMRLPAGAELRFTPGLHRTAVGSDGAVSMRVTIEGTEGGEREIWSRVLRAREGAAREVSVALPGQAGDVVRLALYAGGAPADRFAWAVWTAPRVMGRETPPARRANSPDEERKAEPLRAGAARGNVVLVILDAARAEQVGAYGYARPTTPEIDRIAAEGVVFERAYTPAVFTLGALSSLWTSQYPDRHHAEVSYADPLPRDRLTLAEALSARGIRTAGFVANAVAGPIHGFDRGFGHFEEVYRKFPDLGSRGAAFQRVLPEWLGAHGGERFFAYVHYREPHFPYDPGPPFDTRFGPDAPLGRDERRDRAWYTDVNQGRRVPTAEQVAHLVRLYDGNLAYVDEQVGALRRTLESLGLWDKTVLIIAADHGEQLYEKGYISHSAQVYEQSTRVPLIVRIPGGPRGTRVRSLVDLLDLGPTILDLFGLRDTPFAKQAQGASLLPLVAGAARGDEALTLSRTVWERPVYALRDSSHKLVYDTRTGRDQLFAIEADPRESRDLAATEPVRASFYRQTLLRFLAGLKQATPSAGAATAGTLTAEQCENLKALGYADARCR